MSFSARAFYEFAAKQTLLNFISASLQAGRQRRVVFSTLSRVRLAQARRLMGLQSARLAHSGSFDEFYYHFTVLYLEASVLLESLPNSLNPKGPISVRTL